MNNRNIFVSKIISVSFLLVLFSVLALSKKVYAGGDFPTPENVKAELNGSSQIKVSFTMSSYKDIDHYNISAKNMNESGLGISIKKSRTVTENNATTAFNLDLKGMCPASGKYTFYVIACNFDDSKKSSEGVSNELSVTLPTTSGGGSSSSGGSGGSGNSGSGSSGSSSSSGSTTPKTSLSEAQVLIYSVTPGVATISMTGHAHGIGVEVYKGSKRVAKKLLGYYGNSTVTTPIPYDKKTTFKYRVTTYGKYPSAWKKKTISSAKLKKSSLTVTKISKTKAGLKWKKVAGATGYRIYKGKKLIKTLGKKKNTFIYSGKGAGSAKYQVQAIRKISAKKTASGPKSKAKKGLANVRTYNFSGSTSGMRYGKANFRPKKITLSGNTYTISGYAVNSRIFKLIKFKKLDITILCNGKKVAHKNFKNYRVNINQDRSKKITLKVRGKGGVDFRNATGTTIRWSVTPYWQYVGTKAIN